MNWAHYAIEALARGEACTCTPHGNSMKPRIESGATVSLRPPASLEEPSVGDVVLVRVRGSTYLHLVKAVRGGPEALQYQIGNNRSSAHVNGWASRASVYGIVTDVKQPG